MTLHYWAGYLVGGLLLVTACMDAPSGPSGSTNPVRELDSGRMQGSATSGGDLQSIPRFSLSVAASGSFRPGTQATISVLVRAKLPTQGVTITVVAPELEAFRPVAGRLGRPTLISKLPERSSETVALGRGQEYHKLLTVELPGEGYYRVVVTARKVSAEPGFQAGLPVQDVASEEAWMFVRASGGRSTRTFDASLVADQLVRAPGPRIPSEVAAAACQVWQVVWFNNDVSAYQPVVGALVKVFIGKLLSSRVTDATGRFSICTSTSYNGDVYLTGGGVDLVDAPRMHFSGTGSSGGGTIIESSSAAARVYANFIATVPRSQSILGVSRGSVQVSVPGTSGNSFYSSSSDKITIYSNDVLGSFGIFTVAHEYGHAVHQKALGGNAGGGCPSPHFINGAYSLRCAFSEGFADFHAAITRGDTLKDEFGSDSKIETNAYYAPGSDGSIVEGAVAAFYYDLVDGAASPDGAGNQTNGDDDAWQFPGIYLAQIIQTCSVAFPRMVADGVDHLTYCFEQRVDPLVTGSSVYFTTRAGDPTIESEQATEPAGWSAAAIRGLWTRDLYGQ